MDELQSYFRLLDELCHRALDDERSAHEFFSDPSYASLTAGLVQHRKALLSASDVERVTDFIPSGLLREVTGTDDRAAAFSAVLELEDRLRRARRTRACGRYDRGQPLFRAAGEVWDRVRKDGDEPGDLIDATGLAWDGTSQLVKLSAGWGRIDSALRPDTVRWLRGFSARTFIRLDPFHVGPKLAPLMEAAIRPAAPDWWRRLEVWPGTATGAVYALHGADPRDVSDYWEYHARRVRRLEVSFLRRNSGHFFGSMEELSVEAADFVLGLMLHMDSVDPVGTEWKAATLGHLDGAINVYEGPAARARLDSWLPKGKTPDATTRTHLFRVDGVPLAVLIPVAHLFLRSGRLLAEWVAGQFGDCAGRS